MNTVLKQRLAGAIFILSLGVILIPVILEKPIEHATPQYSEIPASPGLPKTNTVASIKYVFNEIEANFEEQAIQIASNDVGAASSAARGSNVVQPLQEPVESRLAQQQVILAEHTQELDPGEWTIQLGAFGSRENADGLLAKLTEEGFQSYLKEVPGRDLVRVFVAPGVEHGDAEHLLSELNNEMGLKGIIVRFRE